MNRPEPGRLGMDPCFLLFSTDRAEVAMAMTTRWHEVARARGARRRVGVRRGHTRPQPWRRWKPACCTHVAPPRPLTQRLLMAMQNKTHAVAASGEGFEN